MLCQSSKQTTSSLNNQSINIVHFTSQLHVLHAMMQCKGGKTATSIIAISTIVVSSSISSKGPASDSVNQLQIRRCQLFRALNWTYFFILQKDNWTEKVEKTKFSASVCTTFEFLPSLACLLSHTLLVSGKLEPVFHYQAVSEKGRVDTSYMIPYNVIYNLPIN